MSKLSKVNKYKRTWKKTPTVFQMENTECGAASLAMILAYFHCYVPLEQLRIDCGVSKDGCNALRVYEAAESYGLEVASYKYDLDTLIHQSDPCIIHWEFNHFVVYEGIKNGYAYINDPAKGRRKITIQELDESFTGVVLTFKKGKNFKTSKKRNTILDFLVNRTKNQKSALSLLLIIGLALVVLSVLTASFSKIFIDSVLTSKNFTWFYGLLLAMVFSQVFYFVFSNLRNILVNKLQLKLSLVFGYDFISRMLRLPINFYEQRYSGDLSQRISNNDQANAFLSGRLVGIILDVVTAAFYLVFMLIYNIPLTFISLIGLSISLLITYKLVSSIKENTIKFAQDSGKLYGAMFSGLEISSTIKACGVEDKFIKRILDHYIQMANMEQHVGKISEILGFLPSLILQLTNIIILTVGAIFVIQGNLSMGMLIAFGSIFGSFIAPINNLFGLFQEIQNLRANLLRVDDIERHELDSRYDNNNQSETDVDEKLNGSIQVSNLKFGYSKAADPLFDDVSFEINPGEVIAIVGPSGSGKSSIVKLLSGLYQPWEGNINYDGKDMMSYPPLIISSSLSVISQEIVMFDDTIKNNLTFWNSLTMDKDMINAAKDACIHDTIVQLEEGYNYKLQQDASNLSGGQRQRIEIARALVSNPSILLMDEATSSLDPITEKKIIENIRRRGCSCVIVAHRLSSIRDADKIICLKNGKIVQMGTHDQLKNKKGLYKELIKNN